MHLLNHIINSIVLHVHVWFAKHNILISQEREREAHIDHQLTRATATSEIKRQINPSKIELDYKIYY